MIISSLTQVGLIEVKLANSAKMAPQLIHYTQLVS